MAGELDATTPLASQPSQALQGYGVGSPAFQAADAFTLKHEGGATKDDGIGHTANQGIDQNAHPDVNVLSMTPQQTQAMRHQYWTAVGGDTLAQQDPRLALVAYETAIASGPSVANKFLAESGGDVNKMMSLRVNFMNGLVQRDPAKYGPVAQGWANRNRDLAAAAGLDPQHFGLPAHGGVGASPSGFSLASMANPDSSYSRSNLQPPEMQKPEETPPQPAAAPAAKPAALPSLTPQQAQPTPATSNKDLYLDLLKRRQAMA